MAEGGPPVPGFFAKDVAMLMVNSVLARAFSQACC
jgi:hypothetical protein